MIELESGRGRDYVFRCVVLTVVLLLANPLNVQALQPRSSVRKVFGKY
jgi:hypothetical protein